ncbi:uncharacterized protein LOC127751212 [Frankliniella occidentalis]|uniref:Uncharacterized protein LOC127751212 n=1 Tax=Frankliniella occidentalis TaxID=133901 RepID=A0A9C6XT60_FRAOC|nr:uncharacterized protein LOC127751212 [Frankliniella occidentalis]
MQQLSAPDPERAALSCEDVRKLFDINLEGPAARALAVDVKELGCVPPAVAEDTNAPQQSVLARVRAGVRADLRAELRAAARPLSTHAFGRSIPVGDPGRWRASKSDTCERWRQDRVPTELVTMEEIFGGVTHLKVTRDFVDYLRHKRTPLPPCLRSGQLGAAAVGAAGAGRSGARHLGGR